MIDLKEIYSDPALLEVGREAVEAELIERRDSCMSLMTRGNGLVVREKDGTPSPTIRMGMETALQIALKAIKKHMGDDHGTD